MNKLKYLILILFSSAIVSCSDDAVNMAEEIAATTNIIGFVERSQNISQIADGEEYEFFFPVAVFGPSSDELTGTYTAEVSVDPSSTAVEGVHFRLEEKVITVTEEGDFRSLFKVVMLTEGIQTPLAKNPVLVLNVSNAEGPGNVIASGAQISVTMLYLCPTDLTGEYAVTIRRDNGTVYNYTETISEVGLAEFRGESVGHWAPGSLGGTPGFDFIDVCGTITVPGQNLVALYSNQVTQAGDSFVDPETGNIHIEYAVDGIGTFVADYVKQ